MNKYYEFDMGFLFKAYYWDIDNPYEKAVHVRTIIADNISEAFEIANDPLMNSYDLFKLEEVKGCDVCVSEKVFKSHYKSN